MDSNIINSITALAGILAALAAVFSLYYQRKQNRRDRFENTFFGMLQLQQQIVNDLSVKHEQRVMLSEDDINLGRKSKEQIIEHDIQGRNLFHYSFSIIEHEILYNGRPYKKVSGMSGVLYECGLSAYHDYHTPTYFDHYFRHLYRMLKFIEQKGNVLSKDEQYEYASMIRATLSRHELVWLFYNGLSDYGNEKLKPLIEKYCMLKNLREDYLSLCLENMNLLKEVGITGKDLENASFCCTDYIFFLTDEKGDKSKYHLSAFYRDNDVQKGQELLTNWRQFLDENKK